MTKSFIFRPLQFKKWTVVDRLLLLLLVGTIFIGSSGESGPQRETVSTSLDEQTLPQLIFTTALPVPSQIQYNVTEKNAPTIRSPAFPAPEDSDLPLQFLTASHLSSLKHLVSQKKITVRLGLRLALIGPCELLDPQLLLSLHKEPGIYSTGGKAGLFSMQIVGIKKVTSAP